MSEVQRIIHEDATRYNVIRDTIYTCTKCHRSIKISGTGDGWVCSGCGTFNSIQPDDYFSRLREAFLAAEHEDGIDKVRLQRMLSAVTLTVPDMDAIAAEPWPVNPELEKLRKARQPKRMMDRQISELWPVLVTVPVLVILALVAVLTII